MKDPDGQSALFTRANKFWHTDSSFKPCPAKASLLSAREIAVTGCDTEFASTRAAYETLTEDLKRRVADLIAYHDIAHSRLKLTGCCDGGATREKCPPSRRRWSS